MLILGVQVSKSGKKPGIGTHTLGYYAFVGIPAGTYSIFATKENYDTVGYTGIKVIKGNKTIKDFELAKK